MREDQLGRHITIAADRGLVKPRGVVRRAIADFVSDSLDQRLDSSLLSASYPLLNLLGCLLASFLYHALHLLIRIVFGHRGAPLGA